MRPLVERSDELEFGARSGKEGNSKFEVRAADEARRVPD